MTQNLLLIFLIVLSSLYVFDRIFKLIKCYVKGERFTQKGYERLMTFLSVGVIITAIIV